MWMDAYQRPDDVDRTFLSMDVDRDDRLSFDEFAFFYAPSANKTVGAVVSQPDPLRRPPAGVQTVRHRQTAASRR